MRDSGTLDVVSIRRKRARYQDANAEQIGS